MLAHYFEGMDDLIDSLILKSDIMKHFMKYSKLIKNDQFDRSMVLISFFVVWTTPFDYSTTEKLLLKKLEIYNYDQSKNIMDGIKRYKTLFVEYNKTRSIYIENEDNFSVIKQMDTEYEIYKWGYYWKSVMDVYLQSRKFMDLFTNNLKFMNSLQDLIKTIYSKQKLIERQDTLVIYREMKDINTNLHLKVIFMVIFMQVTVWKVLFRYFYFEYMLDDKDDTIMKDTFRKITKKFLSEEQYNSIFKSLE